MAQFSFDAYQQQQNYAQNRANNQTTDNNKIGWLKLADGQECLIRINLASTAQMQFATVHGVKTGERWASVSCLREPGSRENNCPFCAAAAAGSQLIGKASRRIYIPMLVSYKDANGQLTAPQPIIWPAQSNIRKDYARDLATKLQDFGDLREHVFVLRRSGEKLNTNYSIDYIPMYDKPNFVAGDFSVFDTVRLDKHSFYVKTAAEMNEFIQTGAFPSNQQPPVDMPTPPPMTDADVPPQYRAQPQPQMQYAAPATQPASAYSAPANTYTAPTANAFANVAPQQPQQAEAPVAPKFSNFSF